MAKIHDPRGEFATCKINLGETPIKVLVGPTKKPFSIHENIIRKPGSFFDAALKKEWKEGQDRVVELLEDNIDDFELYAQWLYCGKIFCKQDGNRRFEVIASLYILGEKLLDKEFQDDVMDAMFAATHDKNPASDEFPGGRAYPSDRTIDTIYKGTPANSPMRRLMVDVNVLSGFSAWAKDWAEKPERVNHEFLIDLTKSMWEKRVVSQKHAAELREVDSNPGCAYHHHGKDKPCPAAEK